MIKKGDLYYPSEEFQKRAWLQDSKIYQESEKDPVKFWEKLAEELVWQKKWEKGFEHKPPLNREAITGSEATGSYFKWFLDGKINITENALDRNLKDNGDKIALIWEPEPITEQPKKLTFRELFSETCKLANGLKKLGVKKGDRVGIYLPMIPGVIISMLACARIGAIHTVVFSAFSPAALRVRLQDTEAKILITADGYYRRGQVINLKQQADEAIQKPVFAPAFAKASAGKEATADKSADKKASEGEGTKVEKVIVVKRVGNEISWNQEADIWYEDLVKDEKDFCEPEIMDSEDPLFILYTSGSTGKPKGIVHTCGGYTVQAYWTAKWIFDLRNEDIFWSTADVGWITGHTYTCYGPLLNGITFLIFEGAPDWPAPDRWCQIIEKYKVTIFYTAPTAIRMFEKHGAELTQKHKFDSLQLLGSVGEPIDEDAWNWYFKNVGKERCPLVDTWWQTETGGILITSLPGVGPFKPSFAGLPLPGLKVDILDDKGKSLPAEKEGNLVILPPFAPGMLRGIYKNPEKYKETYWSQYPSTRSARSGQDPSISSPIPSAFGGATGQAGQVGEVYFTSDAAYRDKNSLIRIVGRVDDVIKVAGHRITTGELENAINKHPDITECAVVGIPDEIKGEVPIAFVVYEGGKDEGVIKNKAIEQIKKEIGPIALPKEVYLVEDLPKTRSGKIMRRILKKLFTGEELGDLSTLANPESVEKIRKIIK